MRMLRESTLPTPPAQFVRIGAKWVVEAAHTQGGIRGDGAGDQAGVCPRAVQAGVEGFVDGDQRGGLAGGVGVLQDQPAVVDIEQGGVDGRGADTGMAEGERIDLGIAGVGGANDPRAVDCQRIDGERIGSCGSTSVQDQVAVAGDRRQRRRAGEVHGDARGEREGGTGGEGPASVRVPDVTASVVLPVPVIDRPAGSVMGSPD